MVDLITDFRAIQNIEVDLKVPLLAMQILSRFSEIINTSEICSAGGFARGLYMQQYLGLKPKMNDIDIFADIAVEKFNDIKEQLEKEFGTPVRFHLGQFEKEECPRGLIEFALPDYLRAHCAGVESIQLNFGASHPWANAFQYINRANVGMNQIAICPSGQVIASQSFVDDMAHKTMTMNPDREWTMHDWERTTKSLKRMQTERPEFQGWKSICVSKPYLPSTGSFWQRDPVQRIGKVVALSPGCPK